MTHFTHSLLKHRILQKIRATFLSLSEEKKGDVSWSKAITSLTSPSSVFPDDNDSSQENFDVTWKRSDYLHAQYNQSWYHCSKALDTWSIDDNKG